MKTTTLRHTRTGATVTVFRVGPHHWYADESTQTELEWIGGPKLAGEWVARRLLNGGYVRSEA